MPSGVQPSTGTLLIRIQCRHIPVRRRYKDGKIRETLDDQRYCKFGQKENAKFEDEIR